MHFYDTSENGGGSSFFVNFLLFAIPAPYMVVMVCMPARKRSLNKKPIKTLSFLDK